MIDERLQEIMKEMNPNKGAKVKQQEFNNHINKVFIEPMNGARKREEFNTLLNKLITNYIYIYIRLK